ncbi:hypothetical protein TFLX_04003 [Thermoflexales bacterium]|nr:hypothetical protein TFLX_04003 [Thermoflexales bacterium]
MISSQGDDIIIRPEDMLPRAEADDESLILINPDDLGLSLANETGPVIIRMEDLPGVPYAGAVPAELIQIILPPGELYHLERRMLDLINDDRANHGAESGGAMPLEWDDAVAAVARAHSEDMIAQHYMHHVNRVGLGPEHRLRQAGIKYLACGENIAGSPTMQSPGENLVSDQIYTGYPTVEQAETGLMHSPGHRNNILNRYFTHLGVGIARNPDGTLVVTQNFIERTGAPFGQLLDSMRHTH